MAFRASAAASQTGGTTISATPAGVAAGDYLGGYIALDAFVPGATAAPPTGWVEQVNNDQSAPDGMAARYADKVAVGGDAFQWSYNQNGGAGGIVLIAAAWSGRDTTNPRSAAPVATINTSANASAIVLAITGIATLDHDDIGVFYAEDMTAGNSGATHSQIASYTESQDDSVQQWTSAGFQYRDDVSAGATGTLNTTWTLAATNAGYSAVVIALKTAAANTPTQRSRGLPPLHLLDDEDEGHFNELDVRNWW